MQMTKITPAIGAVISRVDFSAPLTAATHAVADDLPAYRCMNRVTVIRDGRANARQQAA